MEDQRVNKKPSLISGLTALIRSEAEKRKKEKGAVFTDIAVFIAAFFFARRHIVFGSYPLATALVAVLPSRVISALIGAVIGALSLGRTGIIHAIIALIILFLRIIISGSRREEDGQEEEYDALFSEPLIMRLSAATIGAFVGAGYEMLLNGFSFTSVLFGVFGVLLTLAFSFLYSGLFCIKVSFSRFVFGNGVLSTSEEKVKNGKVFFIISLYSVFFLFTHSLSQYRYFGISVSYMFVVSLTLFMAKRFGAVMSLAAGFAASIAVAPAYSPAFALVGVVAAFLQGFGLSYAIIGAGMAFVLWGAYVDGLSGFLSLLPEYLLAALLTTPLIRKLSGERREAESRTVSDSAEEMVGAAWLADRREIDSVIMLESALLGASESIRIFSSSDGEASFDEYREVVISALSDINPPPCEEEINILTTKIYKKQKLDAESLKGLGVGEAVCASLDEVICELAQFERGLYERRRVEALAHEYGLISKMINEAKISESRERAYDSEKSRAAAEVFMANGFPDGEIRVFGDRKKRVIGAGHDPSGKLISSDKLHSELERAIGVRLGNYEYFRKGDMALFKCSAAPSYSAHYGSKSVSARGSEISGDSVRSFSDSDSFFAVLSDGMGTGREARECSDFVARYLSDILLSDVGVSTAIGALNHIIRHRSGECSASLDLFRLDLLSGDALFIKSGAAPSYVKRGSSIFRIRSETCPIGVMKTVDAEKIRVEVKPGDYVIMLSDGISISSSDSPWLLTYLAGKTPENEEELADAIVKLAREKCDGLDDMSCAVIRITESEKNAQV